MSRHRARTGQRLSLLAALVAASGLAAGQTPLVVLDGDPGQPDDFGNAVAFVGDVDGDGHDDIVVGAKSDGPNYNGGARLLSGADGTEIRRWQSAVEQDRLGFAVAGVGDVEGDDVPDVLVGATQDAAIGGWTGPGYAELYSGADGHLIERFDGQLVASEFGFCVAALGDLDGDGQHEFAIGSPRYDTSKTDVGALRVYSGATLQPMLTFFGSATEDMLGWAAADAGDVDADGTPDILVGAPSYFGWIKGGHVRVFSGATGTLLRECEGGHFDDFLGRSVCGLGDVDGDGHADFAAGMPGLNRVLIYSGATGGALHTVQGKTASDFGNALANAGDLDADGVSDLVVCAYNDDLPPNLNPNNSGSLSFVSGADGAVLWKIFAPESSWNFGGSVATGGDLDADGSGDLVVGEPRHDAEAGGFVGRAYGFSIRPWSGLGFGLAGNLGVPSLWGDGSLEAGTPVKLRLAGTYPFAPLVLIVGLSELGAPFKGGVLVPDVDVLVPGLVANGSGLLTLGTAWPAGIPSGLALYLQAWIVDPSGPAGLTATAGVVAVTP